MAVLAKLKTALKHLCTQRITEDSMLPSVFMILTTVGFLLSAQLQEGLETGPLGRAQISPI